MLLASVHASAQTSVEPKTATPSQQTKQQEQLTEPPPAVIVTPEQVPRTAIYQPDCTYPANHDDADYCAQRAMADAAKNQLELIWWQNTINGAEAVGLLVVIILTLTTIGQTRHYSHRELRAYIEPTSAGLEFDPEQNAFIGTVEIKNCGSTPAYKVRNMTESFAANYPLTENRPHPEPVDGHSSTLAPGQTINVVQRFFLVGDYDDCLKTIKSGKYGLWLHGTVQYEDCFGKPHTMKFRMVCGGRIPDVGPLVFHRDKDGNESN